MKNVLAKISKLNLDSVEMLSSSEMKKVTGGAYGAGVCRGWSYFAGNPAYGSYCSGGYS